MKRLINLTFLLFFAFILYAQQSLVLDDGIRDVAEFFSSRLPARSVVAITNFEAETRELSDFIIQELIVSLSNRGSLRVVERSRMEMLERELNFNMSRSVSDETAQGIGHMIGAQVLISGSISEYRDVYRMQARAIVVETAEIIGTRTLNIKYDSTLTGLLGGRINPADLWKYKWLYAGINVGYSATLNDYGWGYDGYDNLGPPIGFAGYVMFQPVDLFGNF